MSEEEDLKAGMDAIIFFQQQLGEPDIYTQILMEVLLEELFNKDENGN